MARTSKKALEALSLENPTIYLHKPSEVWGEHEWIAQVDSRIPFKSVPRTEHYKLLSTDTREAAVEGIESAIRKVHGSTYTIIESQHNDKGTYDITTTEHTA